MKKLILSLTMMAFAIAAQAGDAKTCSDKEGASGGCCSMKTSEQAKGSCCSATKTVAKAKPAKAQVLMSPKAAAEVASK